MNAAREALQLNSLNCAVAVEAAAAVSGFIILRRLPRLEPVLFSRLSLADDTTVYASGRFGRHC